MADHYTANLCHVAVVILTLDEETNLPHALESVRDWADEVFVLDSFSADRTVEIAEKLGPYKLSIHSGSDKFGVYRTIGKLRRGRVHVKTAGTSYLEALRTVDRLNDRRPMPHPERWRDRPREAAATPVKRGANSDPGPRGRGKMREDLDLRLAQPRGPLPSRRSCSKG